MSELDRPQGDGDPTEFVFKPLLRGLDEDGDTDQILFVQGLAAIVNDDASVKDRSKRF